ncbi:hypothetical protein THOG11_280048 [Vibrio harveyi]|nr:hypothetical protein TH15OA1_380048 [Vibrio harveyi]CAH1566317.1 hypothetical protein THOD03_300048 [Vibrio harveyi]CAH1569456.1 hypothetical protein THOG11_280048 [Vibrio harveyi]
MTSTLTSFCSINERVSQFIVKHNESYKAGATHEVRTRDLNLGKVALYQLS